MSSGHITRKKEEEKKMMYAYENRGVELNTRAKIATMNYLKWLANESHNPMIEDLRNSYGQCRQADLHQKITEEIETLNAIGKSLSKERKSTLDELTDITLTDNCRAVLDAELSSIEAEQTNNNEIRKALKSTLDTTFSDLQDCFHEYALGWLEVGKNADITNKQIMSLFVPQRKNAQAVIERYRTDYEPLNGRAKRKALRSQLRHEHGKRYLSNYIHGQRTQRADYSRKTTTLDVWIQNENETTFHAYTRTRNAFVTNQQELQDFKTALIQAGLTANERRFIDYFVSKEAVEIGNKAYLKYYENFHEKAVEHNNMKQFEERRANAQIKAMKEYAFGRMNIIRANRQSELWRKVVNKLQTTKANQERLLKQAHEAKKVAEQARKKAEWERTRKPTLKITTNIEYIRISL